MLQLLDKNGIAYSTGSGSGKGYNYQTKKDENFSVSANDIIVSSAQPRAVMVKVLFEPESKLVDSATYDITAWALPYVYGLNAYATTQAINTNGGKPLAAFTNNTTTDAYAYVLNWSSVSSAAAATQMLQKGIRLRFSETPFEANGVSFPSGSIIITKKGNERFGASLWNVVGDISNTNKVKITAVNSGMVDKGFDFGSAYVHPMKAPNVVLLTGEGINPNAAGEVWHFFERELKYQITLVNVNDFANINWKDVDVMIMPDGRYQFLNNKDVAKQFEQWISSGGRVVAMERAVAQLSKQEWSTIKSQVDTPDEDSKKKDPYAALMNFADRERSGISGTTPGSIFKVDVDNTHPLMFGYPKYYYTLKMDDAVYEFIKTGGWNVGTLKKENQVAGFVGYKLNPKLKDGLLFGSQELGRGSVTYITDNILFRNFWENGKLMMCNAVFMSPQ